MPKTARSAARNSRISCRRRSHCRLCESDDLVKVLSLTPTPPANAFVPASALNAPQAVFPLDLFFCRVCTHLQLLDVLDPNVLFENYVYVSGTSPVFVAHFKAYAEDMIRRLDLSSNALIVDVGSNDGTLLRFFQQAGMRVVGVDPAKEIAQAATAGGVETLPVFFSHTSARRIRASRGEAALVTANNVFAHADDLKGLLAGVRELLAPDGFFVFEVSYLADVYEKTLFDTIYHEHLAYHSVKPLVTFFESNGMELIEALRVDTHGGSLRGIAQRAGGKRRAGLSVRDRIRAEEALGLGRPETFRAFGRRIDALKGELSRLLRSIKADGKRVAGFGAPAKATTLMYHFGIGPKVVDFIVDDSPLKQGLFSPGYHIPVLSSAAIYERRPDYVFILAWNFSEAIMSKHEAFARAGGRFIVPLPKVEVF